MASELLERSIYSGKHFIIHNPNARGSAPRYKLIDAATLRDKKQTIIAKPKGVTTILGKVIAKDFVSWALDMMADALKEKVPVITLEDIEYAKQASGRKRDSGANTGTEAHALVETFLKAQENGETIVIPVDASQEALNAYGAFIAWFNKVKPEVINVEEVIYSEEYAYAGTYDCMLRVDGKVYLCDLKTTNASRKAPNGVYAEHYIQMGAYALAHEEQRLHEEANGGTSLEKIEGLMVISCKKNGKLDVVTEADLGLTVDDCTGMFKRVVNLFNFMNYATEKLGGKG